ncbi:hypothetical protein HW132_08060 [Brasilonema sp. CT11]|nr:hypothetical protein [Brasilonema sp. CT11]
MRSHPILLLCPFIPRTPSPKIGQQRKIISPVLTSREYTGTCLEKITDVGGDSPKLWQDFLNRSCQQWQQQIQTDINYLTPAQELFGRMIDTIRGIVETEQAERDRSLENTIQIVDVGLGAGAIVSGVVTQFIHDMKDPVSVPYLKVSVSPMFLSLFWSLVATLSFGALAWFWTKISNRKIKANYQLKHKQTKS